MAIAIDFRATPTAYSVTMSYLALFGAFPIAPQGSCLDPMPNDAVGVLRGGSRNGVFFDALGGLLNTLPSHEALRFFADAPCSLQERRPDGTQWTILDEQATARIKAALDTLLHACHENALVVANTEFFTFHDMTPEQLCTCLTVATECSDVNLETPYGADGDSPEFLFAALVSLRGLLRRAAMHNQRIAVFTWSPR